MEKYNEPKDFKLMNQKAARMIGYNQDPGKWRCKVCTSLNDKEFQVCSKCDEPKKIMKEMQGPNYSKPKNLSMKKPKPSKAQPKSVPFKKDLTKQEIEKLQKEEMEKYKVI